MTSSTKYFTYSPADVPEHIATLIQSVLTKDSIFNQRQVQSGKYRGFKIGINSASEMRRFKYVLAKALVYVEKNKVLKADADRETVRETVPISSNDELNSLFPIE